MIPLLAAGLLSTLAPPEAPFGATEPAGAWELVWSDEFDAPSLDATKWLAEDAFISNNRELQYYTPDAVRVRDGHLVITADKRAFRGRPYTAGLVDTRDRFSMAFGRFECRARLPRGQGMWPAFWMLPDAERWPPEIDIMECLGQQPTRVHTTHHWGAGWPNNQKTGGHFDGPDFSADFHVFSVEWTPERLDWYIDGVLRFSSTANIPQDPMYLILNLAVGGNWGGNPDDTTTFPQELRVDWVRAYRRTSSDNGAHLLIEATNGAVVPDPQRWSFNPGERVSLRAEPDIGYVFKEWGGDAAGHAPTTTIAMNANTRVTARFEPAASPPTLLSKGRPVTASAHEGAGFEPGRAVDGSLWSRWSAGPDNPKWIQVDLGEPKRIEAVRLAWAAGNDAPSTIEVSDDATTWTPIHTSPAGTPRQAKLTGLDGRGRYVRLFTADENSRRGCSLFTFEVYGR